MVRCGGELGIGELGIGGLWVGRLLVCISYVVCRMSYLFMDGEWWVNGWMGFRV